MAVKGTIGDYIMAVDVRDFTKNGECSRCGQCCGDFLPVTDDEIRAIRSYVIRNNIKDQKLAILANGISDITCPFQSPVKQKCMVYPVRPSICRTFICNLSPAAMMENKKFHMLDKKRKTRSMRQAIFNKP